MCRSFTISRDRFETQLPHRGRMKHVLATIAGASVFVLPALAHADPCEGALPSQPGTSFTGTVRYVADGDSLCVGQTSNPNAWIEVRLGDFDAPEIRSADGRDAKSLLRRLAEGRHVTCVTVRGRSGRVTSYDRAIAVCRINGRSIGDLLRASGAYAGGR